jgi:threonine/homoserine/homoserine lactone efflux protein
MQHAKLLILCITVLPLVATPGPDIIYIMTRGIAQGRGAALISTVGICAGYVIHTGLAVLGLTALLYASQPLFNTFRYAGAAYLVYLGISFLRSKSSITLGSDRRPMSNMRMFLTGMATSVLNPKGILLFLAYFPQFVTAGSHDVASQLSVIGALFTLMCGVVYGTYALFSGEIGERLSAQPRLANAMKWLSGSMLIGLGVRMALPQRR